MLKTSSTPLVLLVMLALVREAESSTVLASQRHPRVDAA
jgi:hypothetical protein